MSRIIEFRKSAQKAAKQSVQGKTCAFTGHRPQSLPFGFDAVSYTHLDVYKRQVTKHPDMFDRLIEWEKEDNIFHRRLTRRETPSEVKARLLSKSQMGFSSPKSK